MYMGLMMLGRQKYIQQEPIVPEPSTFEVEIAIEKVIRYKGTGQIPVELIKAGGRIFRSQIH